MHLTAKHLLPIFAVMAVSACTSSPDSTTPAGSQGCNAEAVQSLVGQTATPQLLDSARKQAGAQRARLLRPDDVVTLEYDSQRLNLHTDDSLIIERIHCS